MFSLYFRISLILSFLLIPSFAQGAIPWDTPLNRSTGSFIKELGEHTLYVTQDINVFAGKTIYNCATLPPDITNSHDYPTQPGGDHATCGWTCIISTDVPQVCDAFHCGGYGNIQSDPACVNKTCTAAETAAPGGCTPNTCATYWGCTGGNICTNGYHDHYSRGSCTRTSTLKYLVDGSPFDSTAYGYTENAACNPGTPDFPRASLKVEITRNKAYKWDDEVPICVRAGTNENYQNFGTDFVLDSVLRQYMLTNSGTLDTTLTYKYPVSLPEKDRIYPGVWTNKDVIGKGKCLDNHSGCDVSSSGVVYSVPLTHLQSGFPSPTPFVDIAKNSIIGAICPTKIDKLSSITRVCDFTISPTMLSGVINSGAIYPGGNTGRDWFNSLPTNDQLFLTGLIAQPTPGGHMDFNSHIKRLRALSMNGSNNLSSFLGIAPLHDRLYQFIPNSCVYTYAYTGDNLPLIDRIKPTIEVTAQIGSGLTAPDLLLQQEGTATGGVPRVLSLTGSYLAGSGTIIVTIVDSGSSTFSTYPPGFNGISGMSGVTIDVCRTKTHTGFELNNDCSRLSSGIDRPYLIYSTGELATSQHNTGGTVTTPHIRTYVLDLSDTPVDGIRVAGEYEVYTSVIDMAGNVNTGSVVFNIVPEGFDESLTQFDKYDDIEDESSPIYTIVGSILDEDINAFLLDSFANAIDTQTYKLSIFDKYNNPIYNWNLYDIGLTQTGIYLDQVNKTGSSALFISMNGGTVSNIPQTSITDDNGAIKLHVLSYAPGNFLEQFSFSYKNWDRYRNEIGSENNIVFPDNSLRKTSSYLHILTGSVELYTTNRIDLGTANDVLMSFFTTSSTQNTSLTSFTVSNFLESLVSLSPDDFTITRTGSYSSGFTFNSSYPDQVYLTGATGSFVPEQKGTMSGFAPDLRVKASPYVTLTFSGHTARYYVSDAVTIFGSGLVYNSGGLNRIFIEGITSLVGKNGYVASKDNLDINSAETRNNIYKNVALLLRNREVGAGGGIVNRVKYATGDIQSNTLTDIDLWDTLIIKGGNFIVGDTYTNPLTPSYDSRNYFFNSGSTGLLEGIPHKGIIVLKDKNNVGGNIYIKPDVRFIGASLFADESIESVDYDDDIFPISNSARTVLLNKQLVIYGSIFSKNTIGGAVRANNNGRYVLPWESNTVLLDQAVRYDLAFLRMDNFGYSSNAQLNRGHNEFVVILSDPRNIANTLPGFTKK